MDVDWVGARDCLVRLATDQIKRFLVEKESIEQLCAFGIFADSMEGYVNVSANTIGFRDANYLEFASRHTPAEWAARMGNWKYPCGLFERQPNLSSGWSPYGAQIANANDSLWYEVDAGYELYEELEVDEEAADRFHRDFDERFAYPALEELIRRDLFAPKTNEIMFLLVDHTDNVEQNLAVIRRFEDFKRTLE